MDITKVCTTSASLKVMTLTIIMALTNTTLINTAKADTATELSQSEFLDAYQSASNIKQAHLNIAYDAEQTASKAASEVLTTVRQMALDDKEIISGSCWDYLNAAFERAGVKRNTIFKGAYPNGAFVDTSRIQSGDWLYYVNHSYNDVQHSGLFIGWVDESKNEALILSYAGESRQEPARYRVYDVSHTYNIMRPAL